MKKVHIIMYYWGGQKYGYTIKTECGECGINTGILEDMKQKEFKDKPVEVTIKPWLDNFWTALYSGGWHAPIVLVDGELFSQGIVIDREKLALLIERNLTS